MSAKVSQSTMVDGQGCAAYGHTSNTLLEYMLDKG